MKLELFDSDNLNFVEFNITGSQDVFVRCDSESKFLDTNVFNLFIDCFEQSNKIYDYFEPTLYNARTYIPLLNLLKKRRDDFMLISSLDEFNAYYSKLYMGMQFIDNLKLIDPQMPMSWKIHHEKIIKINTQLIDLVHLCIDDDRFLWVIGY